MKLLVYSRHRPNDELLTIFYNGKIEYESYRWIDRHYRKRGPEKSDLSLDEFLRVIDDMGFVDIT